MGKKFVAKNSRKRIGLKILGISGLVVLSSVVTFNVLSKIKIKVSEDLKIGENLFSYATNQENLLSMDLLDPTRMLKVGLNYVLEIKPEKTIDEIELVKKHVNDTKPVVYIYNSHESESFDSSLAESYNIKYNVKIASYILSDYLKDFGITSYVEPESISEYMKNNDLLYKDSYLASAHFIKKRLEEFPSIEIMIDLHRDSISRTYSTVTVDGKSFAKVMFVVGMDYEGYESNLALAEKLNSKIDSRLSRGISKKTGSNVNGIYNQNLLNGAILIEVGGVDNTIEEVAHTAEMIAKAIFDMREDDEDGEQEEN